MSDRFAEFAALLQAQADAISAAKVEEMRLARTDPAARWRKPGLLWPRFTQGS